LKELVVGRARSAVESGLRVNHRSLELLGAPTPTHIYTHTHTTHTNMVQHLCWCSLLCLICVWHDALSHVLHHLPYRYECCTTCSILMNESCLIRMSHVSYEWVMSHMNESCLIWMSHVSYQSVMSPPRQIEKGGSAKILHILVCTYEWVMSHTNESCLIWMSHVSYEWDMTHMNESCLIWMSHVSYQWVMSHTNESCLIPMSHVSYKWVMSHTNESCLIQMSHVSYQWVVFDMNVTHKSNIRQGISKDAAPPTIYICMNQVSYEYVTSHTHQTEEGGSAKTLHHLVYTYAWIMIRINESRPTHIEQGNGDQQRHSST